MYIHLLTQKLIKGASDAAVTKKVSCSITRFISLSKGDKVKVQAKMLSSGTATTVADSFRFYIRKA